MPKPSFKLPKKDSTILLILAIIYIVSRLPVLFYLPFIQDESIYAMMIQEQAAHPTLVPTFLSYPVSWKPSLFFWTYDVLARPLLSLLPLEVAYRLPSFVFGLATIFTLYYLMRNAGVGRNTTFLSMLIFLFSIFTIYPDSTLLTDAMAFFFISCSLYVYSESSLGRKRFLIAAALAFTAFWVKLVVAFMIPVLAVAYFLTVDRKVLSDKIFLLSLAAVPLAMVLHYALMDSYGLAKELYFSDVGGHILSADGVIGQYKLLISSFSMLLFTGGIIWYSLSLIGFWKNWKASPFMSAWFVLSIVPFFTSGFMPWYYLPVMPAIGYFAVLTLTMWEDKERIDALFGVFFVSLLIIVSVVTVFIYSSLFQDYFAHRDLGLMISGKENVLVIGQYTPGVVAYKTVPEMVGGKAIDFGWIILPDNLSLDDAKAFITDYHSDPQLDYPLVNGSFSSFFTKKAIYRKDTNLTAFDFIVLSGPNNLTLTGYMPIYTRSNVTIYEVK